MRGEVLVLLPPGGLVGTAGLGESRCGRADQQPGGNREWKACHATRSFQEDPKNESRIQRDDRRSVARAAAVSTAEEGPLTASRRTLSSASTIPRLPRREDLGRRVLAARRAPAAPPRHARSDRRWRARPSSSAEARNHALVATATPTFTISARARLVGTIEIGVVVAIGEVPVEQRRDAGVLELGVIAAALVRDWSSRPSRCPSRGAGRPRGAGRSAGCPSARRPSPRSRPTPCADPTGAARRPTDRPASRSGTCRRSSPCPRRSCPARTCTARPWPAPDATSSHCAAGAVLVAPDERQRPARRRQRASPRSPRAARSPALQRPAPAAVVVRAGLLDVRDHHDALVGLDACRESRRRRSGSGRRRTSTATSTFTLHRPVSSGRSRIFAAARQLALKPNAFAASS